jgi:hypothetical protein
MGRYRAGNGRTLTAADPAALRQLVPAELRSLCKEAPLADPGLGDSDVLAAGWARLLGGCPHSRIREIYRDADLYVAPASWSPSASPRWRPAARDCP